MPVDTTVLEKVSVAGPWSMLIDGAWVQAASGQTFAVLDPATGERIADAPAGDKADIDLAVAAARRAFDSEVWMGLGASARARIMFRIADLIEASVETIAQIETADNGMPLQFSRLLAANAAETFRYFAGWVTKIHGTTADFSTPALEVLAYTRREPVGVAGLIIPWNSPFSFACSKLAVCLAAGCTAVLKPAEETPMGALLLAQIVTAAGVPAGVVNVVTGGRSAGAALAAHPHVDKIAFTGSTQTGREIIRSSIDNFKKLTLELGGKSPVLVFDDADLDKAMPGAALGIYRNSGQICMAGSRIYVQRGVYDRFVEGVAKVARTLPVGAGTTPNVVIGPLISARQRDRVLGYIDNSRNDGAEVVAGGKRWGDAGYFIEPTLIAGADPVSALVREEIFGPVAAVIPFDDFDEGVAMANDSVYGLAAAIWTRDNSRAHRAAKRLKAGTVWVNCQLVINQSLPFGGYRQSGWGRENGWEGLEAYLQTKTVISAL
ncbi:MAG TPA: aldehyde dehydrogenase family protein [Steroidobacter sp.]|nr:aldehyde dehydrogenase family protein [Steroidobacter sp.]